MSTVGVWFSESFGRPLLVLDIFQRMLVRISLTCFSNAWTVQILGQLNIGCESIDDAGI